MSDRTWQSLILVLSLVIGVSWIWAARYADRSYDPGMAASLDFEPGAVDVDNRRLLVEVDPESDLARAGGKPGDRVTFDHRGDLWRSLGMDERVGVTLYTDGGARHVDVATVPDAAVAARPLAARFINLMQLAIAATWWVLGLLIAWRRPGAGPLRALTMALTMSGMCWLSDYWPGGAFQDWFGPFNTPIVNFASEVGIGYFSLAYPTDRPHWRLRWVRLGFGAIVSCYLAFALYQASIPLGVVPLAIREGFHYRAIRPWMEVVANVIPIVALALSARLHRGMTRQRIAWILFSLGINFSVTAVLGVLHLFGVDVDMTDYGLTQVVVLAIGNAVLAYGLLRHRLFDFGFAINRIAIYALTGLALGCIALIAEVVVAPWFDIQTRSSSLLFSYLVAMLLIAAFVPVRAGAERIVQAVLYPHWQARNDALRSMIQRADEIRGREPLLAHYLEALRVFTGGAQAAFYECRDDRCVRLAGDFEAAPALFTPGESDQRRIVADQMPRELQALAGENAVIAAVLYRESLSAFLLLGGKPNQHQYRPDERQRIARLALQLNEDLQADAQRVHGRTLEELAATEQRARASAESANQAKSSFLATMSHEIRTPMNGVIGMSALLLDTTLDATQRDYAATIRDSGEALLTIINDILDFSKIEAGRMDLESQPFELRRCVDSAIDLVRQRAVEKRLELVCRIDGDVPDSVSGDVTRLRQVLLNLLSNAIKFTAAGRVVVTVSKGAADLLEFTVVDSGIGLSEAGMARLFQRFSQADSSTTRHYGGTGLGLVISQRLAELMGGTMTAESAGKGHGCTFRFSIAAPAAAAIRAAGSTTPSALDPTMAERHPLRILLAEDNLVNQKLAMRLLQQMGYRADLAVNGLEAIEQVERQRYDVVLMDVQMPEMDGLEASRRITKRWPTQRRPRIVAMTANAMQGDRQDCLGAGMDDYLTKPIRVDQLVDSLRRIIPRTDS
jgi:signal transduction histidine kinase/ActR/RegA family two-component response regulator